MTVSLNKLIKNAVRGRKVTILISIVILLYGIFSYYYLPRQENPDVTSPSALITTVFPGASAEDITELVTKKIEDEAAKIDGIEYIESISSNSFSAVIVTINYDVDKEEQWDKLRNVIEAVQLPEGCYNPVIDTESIVETAGMIISISGENYSYDQLEDFAQEIKYSLMNIEGLRKVDIEGKVDKKVFVKIDIEKLNQYAVSIEDIYNLLKAQNVEIPSGSIETDSTKIDVKIPGSFQSLDDIKNLIVTASQNGSVLRLSDIADVYFGEQDSKKYLNNGDNAVLITGYFNENKNIVLIGDKINESIEKAKEALPDNVEVYNVTFQPQDVKKSINDFIFNLIEGIAFVIIVVLIGMGLRNALIVSTAIPLSILAAFIVMKLIDIELHQISIAALIIALGILVDNSIVIADAIQVKINEGIDLKKASIEGAKESSGPVFSSTLTTIAAFATLIVLPGEAGEFAKSLPIVVIIALIASYVTAMFITPTLASVFFRENKKMNKQNSKSRRLFNKMLNIGLKHGRLSVISVFTVLIISIGVGIWVLPLEIFPYTDKDYVYIDIKNEKKGDIKSTADLIKDIEGLLNEEKAIENITSSIGGYLPKFYLTVSTGASSDDFSQLLLNIDLSKDKEFNDKEKYALHLQKKLEDNVPGAEINVKLLAITAPGSDIEVRLSGNNRDDLNKAAETIKSELALLESTYNVNYDITKEEYEYYLNVNTDEASLLGLTRYDIQRQINIALNGAAATIYKNDGKEYDIYLKSNISDINMLENLAIKSSVTNNKILLKQVADIELRNVMPTIKRYNRMSSVEITSEIKPGYGTQNTQSYIENKILPNMDLTGISVSFGGEKETIFKYLRGILVAAIFALAVIYIILLIQFNSLLQPIIILMTVPLSIIGSIFGLWIFRQPFSFTAGLGLASLIGIVVNNAILLIEYINRARKQGMLVKQACINSVQKRFRPIMLSTITTIMGLVPLAFSGSSFFTPMAVTLMCGLAISTIFTLVIIPTLYNLLIKD